MPRINHSTEPAGVSESKTNHIPNGANAGAAAGEERVLYAPSSLVIEHAEAMPEVDSDYIRIREPITKYPSDFLLGLLSMHSYISLNLKNVPINNIFKDEFIRIKGEDQKIDFLKGYDDKLSKWELLDYQLNEECGFRGVVYINNFTQQIVIAFRGTVIPKEVTAFTSLLHHDSSILTDINLIVKNTFDASSQQYLTFELIRKTIDLINNNEEYKSYSLSFTGHSLGAYLAELAQYYCYDDLSLDFDCSQIRFVGFDGPGTVDMFNKLTTNVRNKITEIPRMAFNKAHYFAFPPTAVSAAGRHEGYVHIIDINEDKITESEITLKSLLTEAATTTLSRLCFPVRYAASAITLNNFFVLKEIYKNLSGHSLIKILESFNPDEYGRPKTFAQALDWPEVKIDVSEDRGFFETFMINQFGYNIKKAPLITLLGMWRKLATNGFDFQQLSHHELKFLRDANLQPNPYMMQYEKRIKIALVDKKSKILAVDAVGSVDWFLFKLAETKPIVDNVYLYNKIFELIRKYKIKLFSNKYILNINDSVSDDIFTLAESVNKLLDEHKSQLGYLLTKIVDRIPKIPTNSIPAKSKDFIGRIEELEFIRNSLLNEKITIITSDEEQSGKTSLAIEAAHLYLAHIKSKAYFIDGSSIANVQIAMSDMAREMLIPEIYYSGDYPKLFALIKRNLKCFTPVLFVIDNILPENLEEILSYLTEKPNSNISILLTLNMQHSLLIKSELNECLNDIKKNKAVSFLPVGHIKHLSVKDYLHKKIGSKYLLSKEQIEYILSCCNNNMDQIDLFVELLQNKKTFTSLDEDIHSITNLKFYKLQQIFEPTEYADEYYLAIEILNCFKQLNCNYIYLSILNDLFKEGSHLRLTDLDKILEINHELISKTLKLLENNLNIQRLNLAANLDYLYIPQANYDLLNEYFAFKGDSLAFDSFKLNELYNAIAANLPYANRHLINNELVDKNLHFLYSKYNSIFNQILEKNIDELTEAEKNILIKYYHYHSCDKSYKTQIFDGNNLLLNHYINYFFNISEFDNIAENIRIQNVDNIADFERLLNCVKIYFLTCSNLSDTQLDKWQILIEIIDHNFSDIYFIEVIDINLSAVKKLSSDLTEKFLSDQKINTLLALLDTTTEYILEFNKDLGEKYSYYLSQLLYKKAEIYQFLIDSNQSRDFKNICKVELLITLKDIINLDLEFNNEIYLNAINKYFDIIPNCLNAENLIAEYSFLQNFLENDHNMKFEYLNSKFSAANLIDNYNRLDGIFRKYSESNAEINIKLEKDRDELIEKLFSKFIEINFNLEAIYCGEYIMENFELDEEQLKDLTYKLYDLAKPLKHLILLKKYYKSLDDNNWINRDYIDEETKQPIFIIEHLALVESITHTHEISLNHKTYVNSIDMLLKDKVISQTKLPDEVKKPLIEVDSEITYSFVREVKAINLDYKRFLTAELESEVVEQSPSIIEIDSSDLSDAQIAPINLAGAAAGSCDI